MGALVINTVNKRNRDFYAEETEAEHRAMNRSSILVKPRPDVAEIKPEPDDQHGWIIFHPVLKPDVALASIAKVNCISS